MTVPGRGYIRYRAAIKSATARIALIYNFYYELRNLAALCRGTMRRVASRALYSRRLVRLAFPVTGARKRNLKIHFHSDHRDRPRY